MRADIQALRAVAVLGVVFYHLWPNVVRAGFAGVDVFFVISGYLITQQLVHDMSNTGRVSLTQFWARRIRRLLPAAFTVLAASMAFLFLVMPRLTWQQNVQEIRASAMYFENWLLAQRAVDYLAAEHSPSLVQQYWSLSVEEQFYVAWPLLILLAVLLGRRARRAGLLTVLGLAFAVSLVASVRWTAVDAQYAFFATPVRAWQFAAGGLVAVLVGSRKWDGPPRVRHVIGALGFAVVLGCFCAMTAHDPFPGWVALGPVAGAVLVLAADAPAGRKHVISWRPVQWLGNTSYSLYLWHWPLLIGLPWVVHGRLTTTERLVVLALSIVLAGLTRRFVEDPIRTGVRWRRNRWPAYAFAITGVVVLALITSVSSMRIRTHDLIEAGRARAALAARESAAESEPSPSAPRTRHANTAHQQPPPPVSCFGAGAIVNLKHCPHPFARPAHLDTVFAAEDGPTYRCLQDRGTPVPVWCTFGARKHPTATIAIVGNSHARRLVPALDLYGRQHGWKILVATEIDCMGLSTTPVVGQVSDGCMAWSAAVQHTLLTMNNLTGVIFASHIDAQQYLAGLGASRAAVAQARQHVLTAWARFRQRGIPVLVTGDVPGMRPTIDPECIAQSQASNDPCAVPRSTVVKPNLLTRLAQQHPELATYVPLTRYFCDAHTCHALIGGVVVYFDAHHLTDTYSRSLAPYLGSQIAAALS